MEVGQVTTGVLEQIADAFNRHDVDAIKRAHPLAQVVASRARPPLADRVSSETGV